MKFFIKVMLLCLTSVAIAQTQVSGTVSDSNGQPVPGASVVLDTNTGTVTDFDGKFSLSTSQAPPFTLTISNVGLETKTVTVSSAAQSLSITLGESSTQLDEIVISASRIAQRLFESPVTVEKFSTTQIQATPSADYFNGLANLKSVNVLEAGLVFSQISLRGFTDIYNEGLVTLVDGMNNQAPVFGFGVGNLIGVHDIDVQSVEVLPGAASALYGADAYKGIVFINSKNPFDHEGLDVTYRRGQTEQDAAGTNMFEDFAIRMGGKLSDKVAVKATFSHKWGSDWLAADYRHTENRNIIEGYSTDNPDYNAVNVEGEQAFTSGVIAKAIADTAGMPTLVDLFALSPNYFKTVYSTGYKLVDLMGNDTYNTKGNFAIHYRPDSKTELSVQSLIGTGKAPLYTGATVYNLDDVVVQQHKLELKRGGLKAKFFYTHEDAGNTSITGYDAVNLANNASGARLVQAGLLPATSTLAQANGLQNAWGGAYIQALLGGIAAANGIPTASALPWVLGEIQTHIQGTALSGGDPSGLTLSDRFGDTTPYHMNARGFANVTLPQPGTAAFNQALASSRSNSIEIGTGSIVQDLSKIFNYEVDYDFGEKLSIGNLIVGATYRNYELATGGTLYTDYDAPIEYSEYGAYAQLKRNLMDEKLTLTASARYDKQSVLESGNFTPRLGLLYNISDNQNLRITAQTGFRNPTNQDKFIGLNQRSFFILGNEKGSIDRFNSGTVGLVNGNPGSFTGNYVMNNSVNQVKNADGSWSSADLNFAKAETVSTVEVGYRFNSPGFTFDISGYFNAYKDKIAGVYVYTPYLDGDHSTVQDAMDNKEYFEFQIDSNIDNDFSAYGVSFEAIKTLTPSLTANLVYEFNDLDYTPDPIVEVNMSWNTPEHRIKAGLNYQLADEISLSANGRYNSEYFYESSFFNTDVPENIVLDAKLSVAMDKLNSILEIGGNNIGGDNYIAIPGSGLVGTTYYAALKVSL
jgi:outer membrane receptor protein involved in Fe transport